MTRLRENVTLRGLVIAAVDRVIGTLEKPELEFWTNLSEG